MTALKRRNPRQPAQSPQVSNKFQRGHSTATVTRTLPPYARSLHLGEGSLFVLTGSEAWERAKEPDWMPGRKVVLPPNRRPDDYLWTCAQWFTDCIIVACGHPMPFEIIVTLAGYLLVHADLVLYVDVNGQAIRLSPTNRAA